MPGERSVFALIYCAVIALAILIARPLHAEPLDSVIVVALDMSESVDMVERGLELQGTAAAFNDPDFLAATSFRPVAVAVVIWAERARVILPWTVIASPADAEAVGASLLAFDVRSTSDLGSSTSIASGLQLALSLLGTAPPSTRRIINVAGDGVHNTGGSPQPLSAAAEGEDILINGLVVGSGPDAESIENYYRGNVINLGGRVFRAATFEDFARASIEKLKAEYVMWGQGREAPG